VNAASRLRWTASLLVAACIACSAAHEEAQSSLRPKSITPNELADRIQHAQAPLILDVRSESEYASGHIPGSVNVPYDQLPGGLSKLGVAKTEEIVVHCQSGRRASMAEDALIAAGYTNVRDLDGHMAGWQKDGYPIEKP